METMIRFHKMDGLGNDFVVVDPDVDITPDLVRRLCDRRRGVGADGVLRVSGGNGTVRMEYWNADGSEAEMCGNGLRCVARYAWDRGLTTETSFTIETPSGPKQAEMLPDDLVRVELGPVTVGERVELEGREFITASVGNPHAVTFVADPGTVDVAGEGRRIGTDHATFAAGTNVEYVTVEGPGRIRLRVWERGVGETLACGSGMVASAVVARSTGHVAGDRIQVEVPGGAATVVVDDHTTWLEGPARYVFTGEFAG